MFRWTVGAIEILRTGYGVRSASTLAAELGTSRNAVVGKASRLGLSSDLDNTGKVNAGIRRGTHPGMNRPRLPGSFGASGQSRAEIAIDLPFLKCEPVGLADLKRHHCRWPLDGGMYCGLTRWGSNPYGDTQYCKRHHVAAHKPVSEHIRLTRKRA